LEAGNPIPNELKEKAKRRLALGERRKPLPEHIRRLFPARFVDSELGSIPEGWKVKPIGNLFDFVIGGDWGKHEASERFSQRVAVIRGTDFENLKNVNDEKIPIRFVEKKKLAKRKLLHGDLILEISGGSKDQPTGRAMLVTRGVIARLGGVAIPASFCRLIRPKSLHIGYFLWAYLQDLYEAGGTWKYQNQSTGISNFQFSYFSESELLAWPENPTIVVRFSSILESLFSKIDNNQLEIKFLASLRDVLLPKLVSGEIRVRDAEKFIKEAT